MVDHCSYTHSLSSCEIKDSLNRIWTHDLRDTGAELYQLSSQTNRELVTLWVCNIPVEGEECKWMYEMSYMYKADSALAVPGCLRQPPSCPTRGLPFWDSHDNLFFPFGFLVLHWSLKGKINQFRMFKSICEVKTSVFQWLWCIRLTLACNDQDSSFLVYFV